ncbi:hypothetical protein A3759_08720 [Thalassolituus sp. HI0120]|nr:hypothetical protein A3759_08720 [Thalassolituus sp. HI0120]
MKIFGYCQNKPSDSPESLSEVTLLSNPKKLRELAKFLQQCADEIEQQGEEWEHKHFDSDGDKPSIIVYNEDRI